MNKTNDQVIKRNDRRSGQTGRSKSLIVFDSNGSASTFRQFYQSGGRDYEQYRRWLQTLSNSEQESSSSNPSDETNSKLPVIESNRTANIVPRAVLSHSSRVHQQNMLSIPRLTRVHPLLKPARQPLTFRKQTELSVPLPAFLSSASATAVFKAQNSIPHQCSKMAIESIASPSSFVSWSVADVAQFIEKHFPENKIAQKFIQQKIDGRTLALLTEDHLTRVFKMKLGPALHLLRIISDMQRNNLSNSI